MFLLLRTYLYEQAMQNSRHVLTLDCRPGGWCTMSFHLDLLKACRRGADSLQHSMCLGCDAFGSMKYSSEREQEWIKSICTILTIKCKDDEWNLPIQDLAETTWELMTLVQSTMHKIP